MASKARARATTKKTTAARAKAHDQKLLARAESENDLGILGEYVREQLAKACDQLGCAIAFAQQAGETETVEAMTPVLATLWSTRLELGETVGGAA